MLGPREREAGENLRRVGEGFSDPAELLGQRGVEHRRVVGVDRDLDAGPAQAVEGMVGDVGATPRQTLEVGQTSSGTRSRAARPPARGPRSSARRGRCARRAQTSSAERTDCGPGVLAGVRDAVEALGGGGGEVRRGRARSA